MRFGLLRTPGFTSVAVLTLVLGIGASTAIFNVCDALVLRPLPHPDSDRLVALTRSGRDEARSVVAFRCE